MVDAGDAPYAVGLVARLLEARVDVLCDRVDADLANGASAELIGELEEITISMPLRERLTGQLMLALAAAGRSPEALVVFAKVRERLGDELGAEPSQPLQDIHLAVLRGESVQGGPKPRAPALRAPLTTFVGREDELKRIHELLSSGRLATIVGPGGAGKTRLAGEAARSWASPHRWDGDWLVELAPVTDEANLVQAFLTALGVREARRTERPTDRPVSREPMTRLLESLRDTHGLLLVDNCEHLIDGVALLVAQLLSSCPDMRVLATSREAIGIDGESLCVVPPLALPLPGVGPQQALTFPSVQLLADRACAVRADFEVTAQNVDDVVEIVRRLDGLPLAIELAAARLRVLPVAEVAARLSDRFRLLTGGNRAAMPRHRTLRAVVEWSWDLLSAEELLLAERLSVFPAGASAPSAEAVCAGEGLVADEIPELLDSLVDKSLLHVSEEGGLRYRMLETIREYGVERLAERGEIDRVRHRYARHFAAVVADAAPKLRGPDQVAAFAVVEREHDNIVAALRFLGDSGEAAETLSLAIELSWYWMLRNEHSDAYTWLAFACSVPGGAELDLYVLAEAGMVLNEVASLESFASSDGSEAIERVSAVAQRLRAVPDLGARFEPGRSLIQVGAALMSHDEDDLATLLDYGLGSSDPWTRAATRMLRAAVAENHGEIERMRVDTDIALTEFRALGDRWGLSSALSSLGYIRTLDGDLESASAAYAEAAGLMEELGANADGGFMRLRLASLRLRQGRFAEARDHIACVVETAGLQAHSIGEFANALLAGIAFLEGDLDSMRRLRDAVAEGLEINEMTEPMGGHGRAIAMASVAQLYVEDDDLEAGSRFLRPAYPIAVSTRDQPIIAMVGVAVAALAAGLGCAQHAATVLGACSVLRGGDDVTEPMQRRIADRLRAELGERFEVCFAAGKALSHEDAQGAVDPALLRDFATNPPAA